MLQYPSKILDKAISNLPYILFSSGKSKNNKNDDNNKEVFLLFWMRRGRLVPGTKLAFLEESAKMKSYLYTLVLGNPMLGPYTVIWLSQTNRNFYGKKM